VPWKFPRGRWEALRGVEHCRGKQYIHKARDNDCARWFRDITSKLWIEVLLSLRDNIILLVKIITFTGISNIRDIGSYIFLIPTILNRIIGLRKFVHSYSRCRLKYFFDIIKEISRVIITKATSSLSIIKEVILPISGISDKNIINILGN
jgi:hypothetical protein